MGEAREKLREALYIYRRLDPHNPQITKIQDYLSERERKAAV